MSDKAIKVCDICGKSIPPGLSGNGFILGDGDYQVFPTGDGDKDACNKCCIVADTIMRWFGIVPDKSTLLKRAGFLEHKNKWIRADGVTIFK